MPGSLKVMQLRHLVRELSSKLELALVGKAPASLIEQLAAVTGILVALSQLPLDTDALRVWATETISRSESALDAWAAWEAAAKAEA